MSTYTQNTTDKTGAIEPTDRGPARRISTETKSAFKSTELLAYVATVIGVFVASAVVDSEDFGTQDAWFYVTLLTIGYLISRGLAKSGSRDFYDDEAR